jgi:hypothetical protein
MKQTLALIIKIPPDGVTNFNKYEDLVIPLLREHGGILERRLRTKDQLTELHILSFESQSAA